MKSIKVKATGVETEVSEAYFNRYAPEGWFIEILPEPKMIVLETPKKNSKVIPPVTE